MIRISSKSEWKGPIVKQRGKKVIGKSIYEVGLIIEGQAKLLAARNYGYMAASINTQSEETGTDIESPSKYEKNKPPVGHNVSTFRKIDKPGKENIVIVGTAVDYAPHQEFGTIKMDGQPFLRPALEMAKGNVLDIVKINGKRYFLDFLVEHTGYLMSRGK